MQKLVLRFKCIQLPNMDRGSLTDAFCIVYQLKDNTKIKIGQTECIADNLNPTFVKTIELNYFFE